MAMTYSDLIEKLKEVDEISLLELLDISSSDIVENFKYLIEEKSETLFDKFEEDLDTEDQE
jgi:hypothetical protein